MKSQHGAAKGDVEVTLRESNEAMEASLISTRSDLITSYRSLDLSVGESAKTDESNAKKEEVPQNDTEDSKIINIDSSIGNDECCSESSQSYRDLTSDLLNITASSQDSNQRQRTAEDSLKDSILSGGGGTHDGNTNDSIGSDEMDYSKSYERVHNSLLESVEGNTEIKTPSACDSGIEQSRGEVTMGGDSMVMRSRGEASMSNLLSESAAELDLSGVMNAQGEESFENSVLFNNQDVQDEPTTDSKTRAHSYDFSYDDATERSVWARINASV
jgi:hypothetical protein